MAADSANISRFQKINITLTAIGALVFASLFAYIQMAPQDFDQRTRDFAVTKVTSEVDEKLSELAQSDTADKIAEYAGRISSRLEDKIEDARGSLDAGIDVLVADILTAACKLDCERREEARLAVRSVYESGIARYGLGLDRIENLVVGEYDEVMTELRSDLSIFSGSNAVAFFIAFLLAVFRGRAAVHLLPVSLVLSGATLMMVFWYTLGQDWVMTVIFSNYWGWTYAVVLAVLTVSMLDIAFNKSRVTTGALNGIGGAFSGGFNLLPC